MKRLPIWRDANLLLVATERAVLGFSRHHKYTLGSELRHNAMRCCQIISRVYSRKKQKHRLLIELNELIDDFKVRLTLAKELHAFLSFKTFELVVNLSVSLGRQAGGWLKKTRAELLPRS